jgi:hypothetical protein
VTVSNIAIYGYGGVVETPTPTPEPRPVTSIYSPEIHAGEETPSTLANENVSQLDAGAENIPALDAEDENSPSTLTENLRPEILTTRRS